MSWSKIDRRAIFKKELARFQIRYDINLSVWRRPHHSEWSLLNLELHDNGAFCEFSLMSWSKIDQLAIFKKTIGEVSNPVQHRGRQLTPITASYTPATSHTHTHTLTHPSHTTLTHPDSHLLGEHLTRWPTCLVVCCCWLLLVPTTCAEAPCGGKNI